VPRDVGGVVARARAHRLREHVREEGHRHRVPAGIAAGRAEGPELLERDVREARLLLELARGRALERLVLLDEAAGQRPRPRERLAAALDQEHGEIVRAHREHDDVGGHRRARELVLVHAASVV
jgi:hypothetical protein